MEITELDLVQMQVKRGHRRVHYLYIFTICIYSSFYNSYYKEQWQMQKEYHRMCH